MLEEEKQDEFNLDQENNIYNAQNELTKGQRIAAAALGFFAFFIVIIWALQFKSGISNPLEYQAALEKAKEGQASAVSALCPDGQCDDLSEEDLKTKDTDGDGLWDYDELNIYGTSPYLEDSDSDGFSDKEEVDSNNNPNCPAGRTCEIADSGTDNEFSGQENINTQNELDYSTFESLLNGTGDSGVENSAAEPQANELRTVLKSAGISDEILGNFTDEELLKMYKEATANQ